MKLAWTLIAASAVLVVQAQPRPKQGRPQPELPKTPEAQLLMKAVRAQPELRFIGRRTTFLRFGVEQRTQTELIWKDGPRSRLEFDRGSADFGQVIVSDGPRQQHYFPDANEIQMRPGRLDNPLQRVVEFLRPKRDQRFKLESGGSFTIANQQAEMIKLIDPTGGVVCKFWIQPRNGMVLKRELFDPTGRIVGSFEYTQISFNPTFTEGDFKINKPGAKVVRIEEVLRNKARSIGLAPHMLPPRSGYLLDSVKVIDLGERKCLNLGYTSEDGRLTVFIVPGDISQEMLNRLGRDRVQSAVRRIGGESIVVLGEIPRPELVRIANSIE